MHSTPGSLETSCGFILLNFDSILLLQYPQGHWSFPKGHVEKADSDHHSTALRELTEETGISEVSIDGSWCEKTEYTYVRRGRETPKQVVNTSAQADGAYDSGSLFPSGVHRVSLSPVFFAIHRARTKSQSEILLR